jgi:hypothetical protein
MFSVMFGAFYFGGIGPHIKAIAEAKVAGKLMFDVIDAVPEEELIQSLKDANAWDFIQEKMASTGIDT